MSTNGALTTLVNAPGTSGTSFTLAANTGAWFVAGPAIVYRAGTTLFSRPNLEAVTLGAPSGDTVTVTRAQQGHDALALAAGDYLAQGIDALSWDTLKASVTAGASAVAGVSVTGSASAGRAVVATSASAAAWTDVATQAELDAVVTAATGTYGPTPRATAPTSPVVGQEWLSSALADVRVSNNLGDRRPIFQTLSGESNVQEVSFYVDGTYYWAFLSILPGVGLRRCPIGSDPMVASNWTKYTGSGTGGAVIGGGGASYAHRINHGVLYQEGSTLYYFGNDTTDNTIVAFTASTADPTAWTYVGVCLTAAQRPSGGATAWGNVCVVKDPGTGTYWMMVEYSTSNTAGPWQMSWTSCATVTGAYANPGAALATLYPDATDWPQTSGPDIYQENGKWWVVYHVQNAWNKGSLVFRATAPTLGADNFTVLDQVSGGTIVPFVDRVNAFEASQVCDPAVLTGPNGQRYLFWTGSDFRTGTGPQAIMGAPLLPTRKRWNGYVWADTEQRTDRRGIQAAQKPYSVMQATDLALTSTSLAGLMQIARFAPSGTDVDMIFSGVATLTGASGNVQFKSAPNGSPGSGVAMGSVPMTAGVPVSFSVRCHMASLVAGQYYAMWVYYAVPAGGTLNIRPVAQAGVETAMLTVVDAEYLQVV